jgi:hypothetical protein
MTAQTGAVWLADLPVATIDAQIDASSCRQEQRSTCDLVRLPHASKRASARARLAVVWGAFGPACQREEPSIVTSESGRDTRALKSDHQNLVPGQTCHSQLWGLRLMMTTSSNGVRVSGS